MAAPAAAAVGAGKIYERISRYALDQGTSAVKVYITLPGVEALPTEAIQVRMGVEDLACR